MIIALDIGTNCGWAVLRQDGKREDSGTWKLAPRPATKTRPADHRARRWVDFDTLLRGLVSIWRPTLIAYERAAGMKYAAHGPATLLIAGGLLAMLEVVALDFDDTPLRPMSPAEWKKAIGIAGNAKKPAYVAAANELFGLELQLRHEDEAAALGIGLAAARNNLRHGVTP